MNSSPIQFLLRRVREIVARDTGAQLSDAAQAEIASLLDDTGEKPRYPKAEQDFVSRRVTILFADLRGFTAMVANQPAGTVIEMLNPCLVKMSEIIFKHQGTIDKFMGDSIMVLFGVPVQRPDDVERAAACAVEMQMAMSELGEAYKKLGLPELYMGIGINTGEVLAGTLGSELYSEYTVIGDEVNLASRIEAFSLRGQVLISEACYSCCRHFVDVAEPIDVHVKGKSLPVRLRELIAIPSLGLAVPRKNARRSHRIEVEIPFTYQLVDNAVVLPERRSGKILDLGYHGARLELDADLPVFSEIKLSFELPMVEYTAQDCYAKLLSRKPAVGSIQVGSEFIFLPAEANMKIQLFVQLMVFAQQSETEAYGGLKRRG